MASATRRERWLPGIESGIGSYQGWWLLTLSAATMARPMPVLPDVGSTSVVTPGVI